MSFGALERRGAVAHGLCKRIAARTPILPREGEEREKSECEGVGYPTDTANHEICVAVSWYVRSRHCPIFDRDILTTRVFLLDLLQHTPASSPSRALVERALESAVRIAQKCDRAQDNSAFLRR